MNLTFAQWNPGRQWLLLFGLSALFAAIFEVLGLPAALLLGPMIGAVIIGTHAGTIAAPRVPYLLAQALISCLIVRGIPSSILDVLIHDGLLFIGLIAAILAASGFFGWMLMRWQVFPGTTAIWACWPGAASAMVLMAEDYGADARLVAFMQYLRVVMVAVVASIVALFWTGQGAAEAAAIIWFPPINWLAFAETMGLALAGVVAALWLKIPGGSFVVTLGVGIALHVMGWIEIELPPWLLAISYALVGWRVGLSFTRPVLLHAARALPQVFGSILGLIVICAGFAFLLTRYAGIDPLTAYLATSPGGADAIAIIAASTHVDIGFVMAMQTLRFAVVLIAGPYLARFFAGLGKRRSGETPDAPPD
ncbi:AbrB family transcriptional regulator [Terrihabitans sp. B22-R8]|uniref:AbrB family transcriptional regulator n=1 Tax=Terrihabitans sp. B22-R8 TaxID=3425128 RepID=UPI00403CED72